MIKETAEILIVKNRTLIDAGTSTRFIDTMVSSSRPLSRTRTIYSRNQTMIVLLRLKVKNISYRAVFLRTMIGQLYY